jgi:dienelactone hydrolase
VSALLRPVLAAVLVAGAAVAQAQPAQVVDLATRPSVRERMLVLQPQEVTAVVVLMTGGPGEVGIFDSGSLRRGGNFLVRSRELFARQGLAVLVLDLPSDRRDLNGSFRDSREHAEDMAAAIRWARQRFGKPVWVVGTSRGTHSAATAGLLLQGADGPDGLVLTSTILGRGGARSPVTALPLPELPLQELKMPVLVVHHAQDPCGVCDPARLPELMAKLPAGRSELITVSGGESTGAPCEPLSHHGFNGIEERVVGEIAAWIRQRS